MSYLPFTDQNVAAGSLSNLVVYTKQVVLTAAAPTPVTETLLTTQRQSGRFVPQEIWFHGDDNGGSNTSSFAASVGTDISGPTYDTISASATYGGATLANQLQQYRAVRMTMRANTTYTKGATDDNTYSTIRLRVGTSPATTLTLTFYVVGYYTGMRP